MIFEVDISITILIKEFLDDLPFKLWTCITAQKILKVIITFRHYASYKSCSLRVISSYVHDEIIILPTSIHHKFLLHSKLLRYQLQILFYHGIDGISKEQWKSTGMLSITWKTFQNPFVSLRSAFSIHLRSCILHGTICLPYSISAHTWNKWILYVFVWA